MEEQVSQLTHWFNYLFGPLALRILHAIHVQPADYETPAPEYVVRLLSLTVCLWANIFASDLIYIIFIALLVGPFEWARSKSPVLSGIHFHGAPVDLHRPGGSGRALAFAVQRETGCRV